MSEATFGGRDHTDRAGIEFERRTNRPCKRLEDGLALVVRIDALEVVDVQRAQRVVHKALEELVDQLGVERADHARREERRAQSGFIASFARCDDIGEIGADVAGGGGEAAMTSVRARVTSGNPPTAVQMLGFDIQDWAEQGALGNLDASFAGTTTIVTGGAGGMGRAITLAFSAAGSNVVVADMNDSSGAEVVEEFEDLVHDPVRTGARTVNLVQHDDRLEATGESLHGHEAGLRHRAVNGVDEQADGIDHGQHALDFTTEVGVTWGIDDVDVRAFVFDGAVFGKNRDATFFFEIVGIHHACFNLLVVAESAGLTQ